MSERSPSTSAPGVPQLAGWWAASFALHAAVLAGLGVLPAMRSGGPAERTAAAGAEMTDATSEAFAEAQSIQAEQLRDPLDTIDAAVAKLNDAATQRLKQYAEAAAERPAPATQPEATRREIEAAQAEATRRQSDAVASPDPATSAAVEPAQARALALQDQALRALDRTPVESREQMLRQDRARQAQAEAQAAQQAATKAKQDAAGVSVDGKKALAAARQAQQAIDQATQQVDAAQQRLTAAQAEEAKAAAATQPAAPSDPKAAKKAQQNLQKARDRIAHAAADVKKAEDDRAARAAKAGPTATAGGDALTSRASAAQATANAAQLRANQAQAAAAAPSPAAAVPNPAPSANASLAEIYDRARAREAELMDRYREVRAADLAMRRDLTLAESLRLLDAPLPQRPTFDRELLEGRRGTPEELAAAMKAVGAEIESMAATARRLSDETDLPARPSGASAAWVREQRQLTAQGDQLALQDAGVVAKDLTAAMRGAAGSSGKPVAGSAGGGGAGTGSGGSGAGGAGSGGAGTGGSGSGAGGAGGAGSGAGGGGSGAGGSGAGGGGSGSGGGGSGSGSGSGGDRRLAGELGQSLRAQATRDLRPIPGRRVGPASPGIEPQRSGRWMFVDTWHLIGPWPNVDRKAIDTRFPPETVVDLDATYVTQANERIGWTFYQATKERITPPGLGQYQIYYGYTELWFDAPQDLWVAIGSDDQSQVWIEDHLIWKSSNAHKDWNAIEEFRKVHFKQGRNRVLFRLENGHGDGGFSFIVSLDSHFGGAMAE